MSTSSRILPRVACKAAAAASPRAPVFPAVRILPTIRPNRRINLSVRAQAVPETADNWKVVFGPAEFSDEFERIKALRGSTFVVLISPEIVSNTRHFDNLLQEIRLLHGNGIKLLLVPSTHVQIRKPLEETGKKAKYVDCYQTTDSEILEAAREAFERTRCRIEAKLSFQPSRRKLLPHELGVPVATGDFLEAERRGVIEGIDLGATGEVKKINHRQIREELERDSVVVVSNLGYSGTREVLNCNTYDVATACAIAIQAEKFICIVDGQIVDEQGELVRSMGLEDVDMIINKRSKRSENGYFSELAAAARVCRAGVKKAHLVDGTSRGALLREFFKSGTAGTVVASSVDNGTRAATVADLPAIKKLMRPLDKSGALVRRTHLEFLESLGSFIVVERDGSIVACAALIPVFWDKYGEVDFAVAPESLGHEQGDKLLDQLEKKASSLGLEKLFLHTTCMPDWFVRRGFTECSSTSIPAESRRKVELTRGSKYYVKELLEPQLWNHL